MCTVYLVPLHENEIVLYIVQSSFILHCPASVPWSHLPLPRLYIAVWTYYFLLMDFRLLVNCSSCKSYRNDLVHTAWCVYVSVLIGKS